jgi:putative heme-binding domain-containing protein
LMAACFCGLADVEKPAPQGSPDRLAIAIAALDRLKGIDLEANPALKAAVLKVLESTKGTPQFVELVRDFKLHGQDRALLDFAIQHPQTAAGVDAARFLLANDSQDLLRAELSGTNAGPVVEVLGNTGGKDTVPLLEPVLLNPRQDQVVRGKAVHALAQTREGCEAILQAIKRGVLGDSVMPTVATELRNTRWPEIQTQAAAVLPVEANAAPALPPISALVKLKGNRAHGQEVFMSESVSCFKCHQVQNHGTDFGPNLSEIGTKLAKEAIYESILDPSAGIAFGYEAWQLDLKNGDEAYGLLASESNDEICIKAQGGIVTRYKKSAVARRTQQKTSIMPAGLAQTMSQQDLVDLVEYLASLKKPEAMVQRQ